MPPPNKRPLSPSPPPTSFFSSSHIGIPRAPTAPPLSPIPRAPPFSPTIPTTPSLTPSRVFSFRPISSDKNAAGDVPSRPNLELSDEILNVLSDAEIVIKTDYVSDKTLNEKDIKDIKRI